MFKVNPDATFRRTVTLSIPDGDGCREETMSATFRFKDEDEFAVETVEGTIAFLRAAVVRLDDIVDAHDVPLPYNEKLRDELFKLPYVRAGLVRTYFAEAGGARLGN